MKRFSNLWAFILLSSLASSWAQFGPIPYDPYTAPVGPTTTEHTECALIIPGPGHSSHIDGFLGAFNGIGAGSYDGPGTCITFEAINHAYKQAKHKYGLPAPHKRQLDANDIAQLGSVLLETSKIIAAQYNLSPDVIVNGLPLIDTSKTIIDQYCPYFLKSPKCEPKRYRRYSGVCNNLEHPHWGAVHTTFKRYLPPIYADGINAPRHGYDGGPLPSPRMVSAHAHRDEGFHDHAVTVMLIAWGQAIDHDITLAVETKVPDHRGKLAEPKCCPPDVHPGELHENCFPISIPESDRFYALFNHKCMSLVRSAPGIPYGCKLGPRMQFNAITSVIDAGWVYGSNKRLADELRTFKGGMMKSLPVFKEFGLKDLLPLKMEDPDDGCIRPRPDIYCFHAGDGRVNEQLVLALLHTLFLREHNRIATELQLINPHWDDETTYQETRNIIAALIQHINYNEFLPMVLGKEVMQKYDLILKKDGYFNGYDPKTNPSASSSFVTAAFRFGHSLLPATIERWSTNHKYIGSQRLHELLRQPYDLYKGGWCDQYMCGLMNQVAQAMDEAVTQEVTNHLFQEPGKRFGLDLPALNMQRAREHGIPSYNDFREFCGLPRVHDWPELNAFMPNHTVKRYNDVYRHPDEIDLWSGGLSERPLPGSMVGPVFACIIGLQFRDLRFGDRYWYENGGWPSSFTIEQLNEIRKIKLSRIICDNSDEMHDIQVYTMVLPDHDINPRVPCKSGILPHLDLTKWKDTRYSPELDNFAPSAPLRPINEDFFPPSAPLYPTAEEVNHPHGPPLDLHPQRPPHPHHHQDIGQFIPDELHSVGPNDIGPTHGPFHSGPSQGPTLTDSGHEIGPIKVGEPVVTYPHGKPHLKPFDHPHGGDGLQVLHPLPDGGKKFRVKKFRGKKFGGPYGRPVYRDVPYGKRGKKNKGWFRG